MKRNLYRNLLWIVFLAGAMACGGEKKKSEKEIGKSEAQSSLISVDTLVLKKRTFQKQIVCNGKLRAVLKSELSFDGTGVITGINERNGDYVEKGAVLA
ncbi:MAG: efflux RND transporter periplasmic adaptor subunit, partial [Odoribacter splanchnicus]